MLSKVVQMSNWKKWTNYCKNLLEKLHQAGTAEQMSLVFSRQTAQWQDFLRALEGRLQVQPVNIYNQQAIDSKSQKKLGTEFLNLLPIETDNLGKCFFNSWSISIFGTGDYHHVLRLATVYDMFQNESRYRHFFEHTFQPADMYEKSLVATSRDTEWAEEIALYTMSKHMRRPDRCYSTTVTRLVLFDDADANQIPIFMHFYDGNRFVALLRRHECTQPMPCVYDEYVNYRRFAGSA